MSKGRYSLLILTLLFTMIGLPRLLLAEEIVSLKNLSWEEQKNKTRIILETSQPLKYNVTASQTSAEVQLEISNLDLKNLPQELFINTGEIVSLRTFPQTQADTARLVVKMTSFRPHQVIADGNKLYIDVGDGPVEASSTVPSPTAESAAQPEIAPVQQTAETSATAEEPSFEPAPSETPSTADAPIAEKTEPDVPVQEAVPDLPATIIRDVRIDSVSDDSADVVLVGDGLLRYDVFELANPHRLVIDLKSVTIAPTVQNSLPGSKEMFSKVRIAQFQTDPKVVRAVIDLNKKIPYTVIPEGNHLRIHLGSSQPPQADSNGSSIPEINQELPQNNSIPDETQLAVTPSVRLEPEKTQMTESLAEKVVKTGTAETAPADNEQFFAFQPDTSLFAQETGTTSTTPRSTGYGVGTFEERTLRGGQKQYTGEPFSFDFKDIDIQDLFRFIADISGLNVILDPSVKGSVTLKLTEVPWDQALDLITKNQGLGYTIEGNVIRIAPLTKIAAEERARIEAFKQQQLSAPLVTKIKPLSYAKAQEVDTVVRKLLTPKGTSIVDQRTNTLIITDIDTNIDAVVNLVETLDSRTAQVVIEARIVETSKSFSQAFGIQWGFRGLVDPAFGNNTTLQFPNNLLVAGDNLVSTQGGIGGNPLGGYAVNLPTNNAPNSAILLSAGNILDTFRLDVALMALENTGNGRILSSPKVATQNNTTAEILQGTQIPVQTVANNTITTTFVNAALRLQVLPQITAEGTVVMNVTVENNRPDFANVVFGTPPIITERAQTTLLVDDGGTTVIGGIFTASDQYAQGRTPVLHRIPLLGWLFKNQNVTRDNRELLIFLTPRILR